MVSNQIIRGWRYFVLVGPEKQHLNIYYKKLDDNSYLRVNLNDNTLSTIDAESFEQRPTFVIKPETFYNSLKIAIFIRAREI